MVKYGLLGLIAICSVVTLYQLYLSNSWTSMIKNKQKEYTVTPSIKSNTKPLVHRLEACAVCLVCTMVFPSQLSMGNEFAPQEAAMEKNAVLDSTSYGVDDDSVVNGAMDESMNAMPSPMATTSVNTHNYADFNSVMRMITESDGEITISLEMLNPEAPWLDSEEFLALFEGKELTISDKDMIPSCDYIVRVSTKSLGERELLFKIEESSYIICDSMDGICYVANK